MAKSGRSRVAPKPQEENKADRDKRPLQEDVPTDAATGAGEESPGKKQKREVSKKAFKLPHLHDLVKEVGPPGSDLNTREGPAAAQPAIDPTGPPNSLLPVPVHLPFGGGYTGSSPRKHAYGRRSLFDASANGNDTRLVFRRRDATTIPPPLNTTSANTVVIRSAIHPQVIDLMGPGVTGESGVPAPTGFTAPNTTGVEYEYLQARLAALEQAHGNSTSFFRQKSAIIDHVSGFVPRVLQMYSALEQRVNSQEAELARLQGENANLRAMVLHRGRQESTTERGNPLGPTLNIEHPQDAHQDQPAKNAGGQPQGVRRTVESATPAAFTTPVASSAILKRKVHDLTRQLPHFMTQVPQLPLTDKEIIVYFMNSLARPKVSLRLYSRHWGPARIAETLNEHRTITPPYLRNTASSKCTSAIRKGINAYGQDWEANLRTAFFEADDATATTLMRVGENEGIHQGIFDVRDFSNGLKMHPLSDKPGEKYSIFTRCVMYCIERQIFCMLSQIHEVARYLPGEGKGDAFSPRGGSGDGDRASYRDKVVSGSEDADDDTDGEADDGSEQSDEDHGNGDGADGNGDGADDNGDGADDNGNANTDGPTGVNEEQERELEEWEEELFILAGGMDGKGGMDPRDSSAGSITSLDVSDVPSLTPDVDDSDSSEQVELPH